MNKIKIMVVDDHDMFRDGIKLLLSSGDQAEVIAEARNGKEFLDKVNGLKPDVVLMDIAMPEMDGVEATKHAHEKYPDMKILALTMFGDEKYYYQMIQSGIKGFVLKSSGISELLNAINQVSNGGNFFSNELLVKIIANMKSLKDTQINNNLDENEKLTPREIEVLREISLGFSNDEIANKLNISATTVRTHRMKLLSKTGCNNTASLMMYAIKNKIIDIVSNN
jgi:DNA-binding NarL/FixJ family response regulator